MPTACDPRDAASRAALRHAVRCVSACRRYDRHRCQRKYADDITAGMASLARANNRRAFMLLQACRCLRHRVFDELALLRPLGRSHIPSAFSRRRSIWVRSPPLFRHAPVPARPVGNRPWWRSTDRREAVYVHRITEGNRRVDRIERYAYAPRMSARGSCGSRNDGEPRAAVALRRDHEGAARRAGTPRLSPSDRGTCAPRPRKTYRCASHNCRRHGCSPREQSWKESEQFVCGRGGCLPVRRGRCARAVETSRCPRAPIKVRTRTEALACEPDHNAGPRAIGRAASNAVANS